ncbi:MAG: protein kinase, partial [Planctomycetota bacterium]
MTTVRFETGQILNNRYRLERVLGKGGMGQVFLAEDLSGGGEVALKTVREAVDESDQRRFEREIRTLKTLEHPHIVPFRDLGWVGKTLFYTMAYLPGVTLEEVIAARGAVSTTEELDWHLGVSLQIAETLGYLHERHIVHRDVKPSNILRPATGRGSDLPAAADWIEIPEVHVSLSDFGLVKPRDGNGALTRSALGTPQYMSPEQIEASPAVDGRSDLYSLGVILYRVATGRLPFERLSEVLSRRSPRPLREFNEELPELLEDAVERLLDFEPFRRPPHAREVVELLRAVLGRKEQRATGKTVATKMAQPSFTGRALELEHLHTAAARAARGEGRWVAITGERGIGKTWLVTRSDFKSHALVAERLSIYSGTFTRKQPHSGFQQLLQGVLRHVERRHGRQRVIETLGRWGRHLRTFFPLLSGEEWWQGCPPVEEAVGEQILKERVFETVVAVLTAHAEVAPRVLLLEDLHYGDEFDLELLHRLVIQAIQLPILVITTHRPDFERRFRGLERLLHEIRAEERLDELEMKPLDQGEARAMVSSMLAPERPISTAFAEFILQRTDGVPLYLLHLTNSLWNRDLVRLEGEEWRVDREAIGALPIPESTRSHFLLILDEISHQELKILNLAAVIGERFSFDLLLEVLEMDEFELDTVCRDLVHGGIIEEHQDGFRFLHSFEQEIILTRLTRPMFRRLHARVGRILERRHRDDVEAHVGEIAEHMYLGGEQQKGLDYLQRAARKAEESYATRTALDYSTKALALSQDHGVRRELLVGIGELHHRLGEPEEALSHFREAILYFTAVEELLIEEGRSLAEEEEEELKAYAQLLLKFGEVYARVGDYTAALENFDKSERISRRIGDRAGIAISLGRQGAAHAYREDLASSERAYAAAVEYYQEVPPSAGLVIALVGLSYVERMRGNLEKALLHSTQALSISEESGDLQQTAQILTGSLVVEAVFNFPGLGQYFVNAALNRDYTLMLGVLVVNS